MLQWRLSSVLSARWQNLASARDICGVKYCVVSRTAELKSGISDDVSSSEVCSRTGFRAMSNACTWPLSLAAMNIALKTD